MKKIILMLMLFAPIATFAQKFGHVDTQAIMQSLPELSKVNGELEALSKQYQNELEGMQREIQTKMDAYQKQQSTMNETQKKETEAELNKLYEKFQQAQQDNGNAFQKAQQEKIQPIQEKVFKAIENVGKAGGYVYIMQTGSLPYISSTLSKDLTTEVKAELNNLRSQINPHFLLNTLNNIYALTAIDSERAQSAIEQLSKLLRHMLYDNQSSEVPLKDEVQFLENYINLMKIRLPQTVDVSFVCDMQNPEIRVAPLVFISLIENAFKHGISPTAPSFIHIVLTQHDKELCVNIENSNYPKTEDDRSGHGIGLEQVQRRLDLAYYARYEWNQNVSDDGTVYSSIIKIKL